MNLELCRTAYEEVLASIFPDYSHLFSRDVILHPFYNDLCGFKIVGKAVQDKEPFSNRSLSRTWICFVTRSTILHKIEMGLQLHRIADKR